MRKHTKEFKNSISTFGRELDSKITVIGTNLILEKEDLYSVKPITNTTLLKTVMKEVDFESKQQIGIGQEINVKSGVKVGNEYEYIDYGNYSVYKNEYKAETDTYSHICYDKMLNTMIDYVSLDITYPINLREYINAIATKCGLEFADKNSTFANYNTAINEDHFNNGSYTFRDVLDYIAQLVGGWFCINDNDELEIRYPELARNYDKVSGENVSFISNVEDKINTIIVDGKSIQETRSGKNLFKPLNITSNGITTTYDKNGVGTIKGTTTRSWADITANVIYSYPAGNYVLSIDEPKTFNTNLKGKYTDEEIFEFVIPAGSKTKNVAFKKEVSSMYAFISGLAIGITLDDTTKIQLEKGSIATDYEPYGVMPSPNYSSEVECVKGKNILDTSITQTVKNQNGEDRNGYYVQIPESGRYYLLLNTTNTMYWGKSTNISSATTLIGSTNSSYSSFYDFNKGDYFVIWGTKLDNDKMMIAKTSTAIDYVPYNNLQIKDVGKNLFNLVDGTYISSGITATVKNGVITLNGTATNISFLTIPVSTNYNINNGETITVSLNNFTVNNSCSLRIEKNGIYDTKANVVNNSRTMTISSTLFANTIIIRTEKNGNYTNYSLKPQLEKGSTATNYEPYTEEVINIDLQGNELCSIGDVKDELVIKDGRTKIIKRIGKFILDGSEEYRISGGAPNQVNTAYFSCLKYNMLASSPIVLSNYFTYVADLWNRDLEGIYYDTANLNRVRIRIKKTTVSSADEFKAWLSTHNTTVYYQLAEEQEIDLGEVDTLNTYNGVNNISLNASMNSNMSIIYTAEYEEFDKHFLKDVNVSFSKKYGAINSVVFSRGGGSDNIYRKDNASINKKGLTEIKIADNPFLEGDDRENFIQPLFDKINGLEFYIMDVASTGIMYLELGDFYYFNMIEDKPSLKSGLVKSGLRKAQGSSGGKFLCLLMNNEVKITQGLEESIYTDEPEITETDYKTASITDTSIKNAIIQTNKNSAEILLKVNSDEVVSAINLSPENIKISSAKLDIDAIATFTNSKLAEAGSTVINGANITTGTLSANRISGGTISASTIDLKGTVLTPTSSSIGGLNVESGIISNDRMGLDTVNGVVKVFNVNGGSMILSNAARLSATAGIGLTSNSTGVVPAPTTNLDLKACSGAEAYLGSMINADGTGERSGITCSNGVLSFRSTGYCTYNGTTVFGSSSKATKENIEDLSQEQKEEVYELIKNIPTKQYDYKKEYGKPFNYGFIIEDIENTKLKELLHITQAENNKDIKMYSTEDLARLELIVIQELMRKIDNLEQKVFILEKERESENNAKN